MILQKQNRDTQDPLASGAKPGLPVPPSTARLPRATGRVERGTEDGLPPA